jgi:alpha-glucosidase (family GH31 glycosyl hydrolase)
MHETATSGVPMVRPLFMEFPDDPSSVGRDHQFMLGADLLVAPVLEPGARWKEVYLPPGEWFDGWEGQRTSGGQTVQAFAPLGRVPYFIRAGAILPFDEEPPESVQATAPTYSLRIYPGEAGSAHFHFDDGLSDSYETLAAARLEVTHDGRLDRIRVTTVPGADGSWLPEILVIQLQAKDGPRSVTITAQDGAEAPANSSTFLDDSRAIQITVSISRLPSSFELSLQAA